MRDADKTLDSYRTRALAGSREYIIKDGLLYKHASPSATTTDPTYVLVLPKSHETETIRAAHSSLFGGHLRIWKTVQRINSDFYTAYKGEGSPICAAMLPRMPDDSRN